MFESIVKAIAEEKKNYGLKMQDPCPEGAVAKLRKLVKDEFGAELSADYCLLLKKTNGLDHNGIVFYAGETTPIAGYKDRFIEGFMEANRGFRDIERMKRYLVYGTDGEVLYVGDIAKSSLLSIDAVSLEQFDSFDDFEKMLTGAVEAVA
jgi:hypothetical protein